MLMILKKIKDIIQRTVYIGQSRYCPVCEFSYSKFLNNGHPSRIDAKCPYCRSLERHRLTWLFFKRKSNLFSKEHQRVLHVAPEYAFEPRFKKTLGKSYLTADLFNPNVMINMDITNINYPDNYFDVIYCSHVLEHVNDDKKAMREFRRVLKNDGWAVLLVPISADFTYEDPSITDPAERLRLFGQEDHVRRYGPDYKDRLIEAGFKVDMYLPADIANADEVTRMGLTDAAGEIYFCKK